MKKWVITLIAIIITTGSISAKVPLYVWSHWTNTTTESSIKKDFKEWKKRGVTGVCYNCGFDKEKTLKASAIAKKEGLEYHAWIPCMLQSEVDKSWYAVNRKGESALDKPAYVPYYTCLDPNNPEVQQYLIKKYSEIAAIPTVDYVQLDYIRYVDVILAKGLWKKYGLTMNEEYPDADYCYCDRCVNEFKQKTGIDIKSVLDPSQCLEWKQFRCDIITNFVNKLCDKIHSMGKKVSADVFPGPYSYGVKLVRQEWSKWNVDAFFPMNYNDFYLEPASWLNKICKEEVMAVHGKAPIYSGLFICHDWKNKDKVTDPENSGLLPSEIEEAVNGSLSAGAKGISLFTPESMTEEHWQALEKCLNK